MAEDKDEDLDEKAPSFKKKLILLLVMVVVLAGISAGGFFAWDTFINDKTEGPTPEEIAAKRAEEEKALKLLQKEIYVPMGSTFTFSIKSERRIHTGQVDVTLVVIGDENFALAQKHLTLMNSVVFDRLSTQSYESLLMPSGRQRLKRELLDALRARMTEVAKAPIVDQVLFTSFVLQ
ncbi:MAG: flagellar basal body-associated protein FliL [Succinivibrio sp.]